jgi:hypothetical protein
MRPVIAAITSKSLSRWTIRLLRKQSSHFDRRG